MPADLQQLEQRSRSMESVQSRQMLRNQSPARMSADTVPVVRSSPRLKVSKVIPLTATHMKAKGPANCDAEPHAPHSNIRRVLYSFLTVVLLACVAHTALRLLHVLHVRQFQSKPQQMLHRMVLH